MKQISIAKHLKWLACAVVVAAAILFAFAPRFGASAQQQKQDKKPPQQKQDAKKTDEMETLKIGTQLVNVLFSVQDKQNRFINDLKQEDIQILENGQPQEIFAFKKEVDLPLTMAIQPRDFTIRISANGELQSSESLSIAVPFVPVERLKIADVVADGRHQSVQLALPAWSLDEPVQNRPV